MQAPAISGSTVRMQASSISGSTTMVRASLQSRFRGYAPYLVWFAACIIKVVVSRTECAVRILVHQLVKERETASTVISALTISQNAVGPVAAICIGQVGVSIMTATGSLLAGLGFMSFCFVTSFENLACVMGVMLGSSLGILSFVSTVGIVSVFSGGSRAVALGSSAFATLLGRHLAEPFVGGVTRTPTVLVLCSQDFLVQDLLGGKIKWFATARLFRAVIWSAAKKPLCLPFISPS
uniref:Solute carrier family 34 member 1 n=1 Tax=Steinernema glaseri TaxID=37863 RepID=A0A1I8APN4_9BILA